MEGDLLVAGISELATHGGDRALRGSEMSRMSVTRDAALLVRDGKFAYAGPASGLDRSEAEGAHVLDAGGRAVLPGFVDSHTHFVFAGYRAEEFLERAAGASYMDIHRSGGGIRATVTETRAADLEALAARAERRAWEMLQQGVTTAECKSGYGLDRETELRQLEAASLAAERTPLEVVPTYMGLHSTPPEFEGRTSAYVDYAIGDVLPAVAAQGIARFADAFCEAGVFGVEDCERFLAEAKRLGLGIKIHAEEIERTGGAALAARLRAASADHLLKADDSDLALLASSGVVATCLPLTSFCLREGHARARAMIDSGCAVALATDLNPGSACSGSIPLLAALAVLQLGMSLSETIAALTINGAAALGLADRIGTIEAGKDADFVILDASSASHLPYRTGVNVVAATVKRGATAWRA
jgi:imidazolonepropionase